MTFREFMFAVILVTFIFPGILAAQVLFSENWSSGSISAAKWQIRGTTANAIGLEIPDTAVDDDFALALRGIQDPDFPGTVPTWSDNIMSVMRFSRADSVTIEFKAWNKPGSNAQIGVHGGFHHIDRSQTQCHYAQDLLCTPEATFDYVVNDIRANESGDGIQGFFGGSSFIDATAAIKANTKNGAATFRITLDTVQGALWQITVPPTNPAHSTGEGAPEVIVGRDTRGIPNFGETTGLPTTVVNNTILNAIGFGQFANAAGTTYVDDIIVFGPNGPGLTGDYNNNGTVDAADYVVWRKDPASFGGDPGYAVWRENFGNMLSGSGNSLVSAAAIVPEPNVIISIFGALACVVGNALMSRRAR